jgi:hypothetical protein
MQETQSRSRWPGIVAALAVVAALAAFVFTRGDVAAGAQNPPAATQSAQPVQQDATPQARRGHDCPEHDGGGGGAAPQEQAPSAPGTEL